MNQGQTSFLKSFPPVTLNIIIVNVIVWVTQKVFLSKGIDLSEFLGLHYWMSDNFYPHQIFTYMFLHDPYSITHVLFNMFAVFMFGQTLEKVWGGGRFLFYYISTGIGAGLVNLVVVAIRIHYLELNLSPEMITEVLNNGTALLNKGMNYSDDILGSLNLMINQTTVGASGAVFGILVAFGMLFPNVELMMIPIPIPIKAKYFVIGYGLLELLLGLQNKVGDNVAHFAHLGGLFVGLLILLYWKKKNKVNGRNY